MNTNLKYWAALNHKSEIVATGVTSADSRFYRQCLNFSAIRYVKWGASGRRYCELLVPNLVNIKLGTYIKDLPHGPIRKSKAPKMLRFSV